MIRSSFFFLVAIVIMFSFTAKIQTAYALTKCPGEPATLSWSSSNIDSCTLLPQSNNPACDFGASNLNPSNSQPINLPAGQSCQSTLTCGSANAADTLTIDPNQSRCCGNWDLSGSPVWNGSTCTVTPSGSQPELTASSPTPTSAVVNTPVTYSSVITNSGGVSTGASFNSFFQWTTGPDGTGAMADVAPSSINTLASGGSGTLSWTVTPGVVGTFSIRACADKSSAGDSGTITESNENNNCSGWTNVTVSAGGTPDPGPDPAPSGDNGQCNNAQTFSCTVGTPINQDYGGGSNPTWNCAGVNGGATSDMCYYSAPSNPTQGVCSPYGWNGYGCSTTGSSVIPAGTTDTTFKWYCSGVDGGPDSPLCTTPRTWTEYCTGPYDPDYNPYFIYEIWSYDNTYGIWQTRGPTGRSCAPMDVYAGGAYTSPAGQTAYAGTQKTFVATIHNVGEGPIDSTFNNFMVVASGPNGSGSKTDLPPVTKGPMSYAEVTSMTSTYTFPAPGTYSLRTCADMSSSSDMFGMLSETSEGNNCSGWVDVTVTCANGWNGSECIAPTGSITPNSCTIPLGQSSCSMNVAWTTTNTVSEDVIQVRRSYDNNSIVTTGLSGSNTYSFPYSSSPYTLNLYDASRDSVMDTATFSATCSSGGWDTTSGTCVNPVVSSAVVTGQYYSSPGTIRVTCTNASKYRITHTETGTVIANDLPYPGTPVDVSVSTSGNYIIKCVQGGYASTPVARYYNAPPPPDPSITLIASPRTISRSSNSTISWTLQHPKTSCALVAKTICANGTCNQDQRTEESRINTLLTTEAVDADNIQDALVPRTITNSLKYIPASNQDTDWKTSGRKTFNFKYTTDFTLTCGATVSQTARVMVTTTGEQ